MQVDADAKLKETELSYEDIFTLFAVVVSIFTIQGVLLSTISVGSVVIRKFQPVQTSFHYRRLLWN